jgi:hypothetical protein
MGSAALHGLLAGIDEVSHLEEANPSPTGAAPSRPHISRVIGRASVVLLSSHMERYLYRVNEEITEYLAGVGVCGDQLPINLRLLHSHRSIERLAGIDWLQRADPLRAFVAEDLWLWQEGVTGRLDPVRLLAWMKTPSPPNLLRYYRYWLIQDIFTAITRRPRTRGDLWFRIQSLIDKRNNIAHGDPTEQATQRDIRGYTSAVCTFCKRADRKLSAHLATLFGILQPW